MQFFREKIEKMGIGWNERPLGEDDFRRLCRRFRIKVTEMPLTTGGFYYRVMGGDYIAIDSRLSGPKRLVVLFHELGHFLFHVPDSGVTANFHGVGRRTRKECEADLFALCAIIPTVWVETRLPQELIDDGFEPEHVAERFRIYSEHHI